MEGKMINKKGHVFAIGLVIATLIICGVILYSFTQSSKKIEIAMASPYALQELYDKETKFTFYAEDSAHLAENQALFEVCQKGAVSGLSCKPYEPESAYVIWNDTCNPVLSIDELFKKSFNSSFKNFIANYPDETLNNANFSTTIMGSKADINFDIISLKKTPEIVISGILTYSAEHAYDSSFSHNLEIGPDEFRNIYSLVYAKLKECIGRSSDMTLVTSCMNELNPDRWGMKVHSSSSEGKNYLLFDLTSKNKFLFENNGLKFELLVLKFAIKV